MKTLIILISAVLFLNTTNVLSNSDEYAKLRKNVRNQVFYSLSSSDIEEKGKVTIYFYVFNRDVKVQKVEGKNETLNRKVKERLERTGFVKNGLNGYYTVTIQFNGSEKTTLSDKEKTELLGLMSSNYFSLRDVAITE
jgi:hypothetical protein